MLVYKHGAVHSFWTVKFSNGGLGASHSDSVMYGLSSHRVRMSGLINNAVPCKCTPTTRHTQ